MGVKASFTFERNYDKKWYTTEKKFNDEKHLENYVKKCISGGGPQMNKYINHEIIHENDKKLFDLNDAQRIFDYAKSGDYNTLKELLKEQFKLRI